MSNDVSIKASDGDLREFYSRHIVKVDGKQSFDFSTIVPIDMSDEDYHGTETRTMKNGEEYRVGGNWYEWNLEHWGTKWNSCNTDASDLVDNGVVSFQTAWCPPEPIMISLAKMYPTFHFEWTFLEEQGWGGVYDYTNGKENIPIIALTASAMLEVQEQIFDAGMNDFVTKPFDPDELYQKIESLIAFD